MGFRLQQKLVLLLIPLCTHAATWDYEVLGPDKWHKNYPKCAGKRQSPINIDASDALIDWKLGLFYRELFYTPPTSMRLRNNGHSLQMDILGGGYTIHNRTLLPFPAKLAQYHLHWAKTENGEGSEHTLNGIRYYGEMHLVHFNTKYPDLATAASKSDGLAVIGVLIEADYPQDNKAFDQLFDLLENNALANSGDSVVVTPVFSVETLLPHELFRYYRYSGSLTTPGCFESVIWTVFEEPVKISIDQARKLSNSLLNHGKMIGDNFRPVQPLNGREVRIPTPLTQRRNLMTWIHGRY